VNADAFIERIIALRPAVVVTQDFHDAGSGFGADTSETARNLLPRWQWTEEDYRACVARMRQHLTVYEGAAGFFPPKAVVA
jgi:hypothetical protein